MDVDARADNDYYPRYIPSFRSTVATLSGIGITFVEEVAELMRSQSNTAAGRHVLLRPHNLRRGAGNDLPDWLRRQLEPEEFEDEYLFWDSLEPDNVSSTNTLPAFWQLLGMTEASGSEIERFTGAWGMLSYNWMDDGRDDVFGFDSEEAILLDDWRSFASSARRLLTLVVQTAEGTTVDLEMLKLIQTWDELPEWPPMVDDVESLTQEELNRLANQLRRAPEVRARMRWEKLVAERDQGKALEQQRRIAVNALNGFLGTQYARFGWDERGRRMEREALGLDDVVFSHIATIFSSPELDVLICSICGKPYPFDDAASGRRPRYGVRRFCSDGCRQAGKRESNRLSWHRNSTRWRRNSSAGRRSERKPDGSQG